MREVRDDWVFLVRGSVVGGGGEESFGRYLGGFFAGEGSTGRRGRRWRGVRKGLVVFFRV